MSSVIFNLVHIYIACICARVRVCIGSYELNNKPSSFINEGNLLIR